MIGYYFTIQIELKARKGKREKLTQKEKNNTSLFSFLCSSLFYDVY